MNVEWALEPASYRQDSLLGWRPQVAPHARSGMHGSAQNRPIEGLGAETNAIPSHRTQPWQLRFQRPGSIGQSAEGLAGGAQ